MISERNESAWSGKLWKTIFGSPKLTPKEVSLFITLHNSPRFGRCSMNVHLVPDSPNSIIWKLTKSGRYSVETAYMMQFSGITVSTMPTLVWKTWAPPKCKIFAWLVLQNRVWAADRLESRGWTNCGLCKLSNQDQETAAHLLFYCRFTLKIWSSLKSWLGLHDLDPREWQAFGTVKEWWSEAIHKRFVRGRPWPR